MATANPVRFSTKYQDDETELLYYTYRYCNASTGRWLSRDLIEETGGSNLYLFVENAPLAIADKLGLKPIFKGCSREQESILQQKLDAHCAKAKKCADCTSAGEAQAGIGKICNESVTIHCVADDFILANGIGCNDSCGMASAGEIYMCDRAFRGLKAKCDPEVGCTLFHEALHVGGLPGGTPHPTDFGTFADCLGCPWRINK
jgi:RHS repeat-associated protein